ncbi:hypothetical protein FIBSPDRAFT_359010 [Athelia psychrophila]|uniref:Uncharacterized protein n=1 Tax=Athelia psychrophila TaxID=1759441 RepID=A0A166PLQ0_9AGAM|nr:hypothetical protein FIBSPDRAFT_359010 [Fibularhizoctonia sp. CBS 109695]
MYDRCVYTPKQDNEDVGRGWGRSRRGERWSSSVCDSACIPSSAVEAFARHMLAFTTSSAVVFPSPARIKPSARLSSWHFHLPPAYAGRRDSHHAARCRIGRAGRAGGGERREGEEPCDEGRASVASWEGAPRWGWRCVSCCGVWGRGKVSVRTRCADKGLEVRKEEGK